MPKIKNKISKEKTEVIEKKPAQKPSFYQAVGRRKESTARVKLYVASDTELTLKDRVLKNGEMVVNNRPIEEYFKGEVMSKNYLEPFRTTNTLGRFTVSAIIEGGGVTGQVNAFIHAVSRALEKVDREKFRPILKKRGFMTRDSRIKERRKAGFAQKARARKQSPKR